MKGGSVKVLNVRCIFAGPPYQKDKVQRCSSRSAIASDECCFVFVLHPIISVI